MGKALYDKAVGGDVQAIVSWEKTRANRSERQVLEHSGSNGDSIAVALTPAERKERIDAIMGRIERRQAAAVTAAVAAAVAAAANGHTNGSGTGSPNVAGSP